MGTERVRELLVCLAYLAVHGRQASSSLHSFDGQGVAFLHLRLPNVPEETTHVLLFSSASSTEPLSLPHRTMPCFSHLAARCRGRRCVSDYPMYFEV